MYWAMSVPIKKHQMVQISRAVSCGICAILVVLGHKTSEIIIDRYIHFVVHGRW